MSNGCQPPGGVADLSLHALCHDNPDFRSRTGKVLVGEQDVASVGKSPEDFGSRREGPHLLPARLRAESEKILGNDRASVSPPVAIPRVVDPSVWGRPVSRAVPPRFGQGHAEHAL